MTDLVSLLGTLVDNKGKIKIEGINELVAPVTEEERALFTGIHFKMDDLYEGIGAKSSIFDNTEQTLMGRCVSLPP
jgi:Cys-Gly metallodipeptidase DUG1